MSFQCTFYLFHYTRSLSRGETTLENTRGGGIVSARSYQIPTWQSKAITHPDENYDFKTLLEPNNVGKGRERIQKEKKRGAKFRKNIETRHAIARKRFSASSIALIRGVIRRMREISDRNLQQTPAGSRHSSTESFAREFAPLHRTSITSFASF